MVTSIILLAQPVVAVFFAMALLGEAPSPGQLLGVGLVIGGIALATVPLRPGRLTTTGRPALAEGVGTDRH